MRFSDLSRMQEQTDAHASQGSDGDHHEKFETGTHRSFAGIACFHCSKDQCGQRREPVGPPASLWQSKEDRHCRDEATRHKGEADLESLEPGIDPFVFYHPQLVMYHGPVPAVSVGGQMPDYPLQQRSAQAFATITGT